MGNSNTGRLPAAMEPPRALGGAPRIIRRGFVLFAITGTLALLSTVDAQASSYADANQGAQANHIVWIDTVGPWPCSK